MFYTEPLPDWFNLDSSAPNIPAGQRIIQLLLDLPRFILESATILSTYLTSYIQVCVVLQCLSTLLMSVLSMKGKMTAQKQRCGLIVFDPCFFCKFP